MTAAAILTAALALCDTPSKWWRGDLVSDAMSCHCPITAIDEVTAYGASGNAVEAVRLFGEAIGADTVLGITAWNDARERTHAEVRAAFERAIEIARRREGVAA